MVRAKFKVTEVTENENGHRIKMTPVTTGSEENKQFFKYTPYGSIEIGTINNDVAKELLVGQDFYVDFTKAD